MSTPTISSPVTTPSGLIVPSSATSGPAPLPPGTPPVTQSGSGLWVPSNKLEVVTTGGLVTATSTDSAAIRDAAHGAQAEVATAHGAGAADAINGAQVAIADQVHADIQHDKLIDALKNGNVSGAVDILNSK